MTRRSARLASLSQAPESPVKEPSSRSTSTLQSVSETQSAEPETLPAPRRRKSHAAASSPMRVPRTPGKSSPVKLPMSEMHPSKVHPTMAHAPSSGLRLGFTDIKPTTNRDDDLPPIAQSTPTKISVPQSDFTFRRVAQSAAGIALSTQAQSMMEDIRKEAEKYKDEIRQREAEREKEEQANRKIAKATGKASRFSEVHMAQFKKMDSIENHPSILRAQKGRVPDPLKKGVKRSQSKANLDDIDPSRRSKEPTPTSSTAKAKDEDEEGRSPAKRLRQNKEDDVSKGRAIIHDAASSMPKPKPASTATASTIPRPKSVRQSIMSPTRSSLARSTGARTPVRQSLFKSPAKSIQSALPRPTTASKLPTLKEEPVKNTAKPSENQSKKPLEKQAEKQASKEIKQQIDTEMETLNEKEAQTPQQTPRADVKTPTSRIASAKSILRSTTASTMTKIPLPASFGSKTPTSKTPTASRTEETATSAHLTTPGGSLAKHVAFTPETQRATVAQALKSPSPVKQALSKSQPRKAPGQVYYPSLDAILREEQLDRGLLYPDVTEEAKARSFQEPSAVKQFKADSTTVEASSASDSFSFRSERTLNLDSVRRPSFGASPGQSTVRPVRPSLLPTVSESSMPGSFPDPEEVMSPVILSHNKENEAPADPSPIYLALPHGLATKKRNRVSTDEEELEMAERAAKRQKQEPVPEGDALLAPRLVGTNAGAKKPAAAPVKTNGSRKSIAPVSPRKNLGARKSLAAGARKTATASASATTASKEKESHRSPVKKAAAKISLSRLEQLARPKNHPRQEETETQTHLNPLPAPPPSPSTTALHFHPSTQRLITILIQPPNPSQDPTAAATASTTLLFPPPPPPPPPQRPAANPQNNNNHSRVCGEVILRGEECGCLVDVEGEEGLGDGDKEEREKVVVEKGLERIDRVDGGLTRQRWEVREGDKEKERKKEKKKTRNGGKGGLSSLRRGAVDDSSLTRDEMASSSGSDKPETIYVNIFDPVGREAFRPGLMKPIPDWMQTGAREHLDHKTGTINSRHDKSRETISTPRPISQGLSESSSTATVIQTLPQPAATHALIRRQSGAISPRATSPAPSDDAISRPSSVLGRRTPNLRTGTSFVSEQPLIVPSMSSSHPKETTKNSAENSARDSWPSTDSNVSSNSITSSCNNQSETLSRPSSVRNVATIFERGIASKDQRHTPTNQPLPLLRVLQQPYRPLTPTSSDTGFPSSPPHLQSNNLAKRQQRAQTHELGAASMPKPIQIWRSGQAGPKSQINRMSSATVSIPVVSTSSEYLERYQPVKASTSLLSSSSPTQVTRSSGRSIRAGGPGVSAMTRGWEGQLSNTTSSGETERDLLANRVSVYSTSQPPSSFLQPSSHGGERTSIRRSVSHSIRREGALDEGVGVGVEVGCSSHQVEPCSAANGQVTIRRSISHSLRREGAHDHGQNHHFTSHSQSPQSPALPPRSLPYGSPPNSPPNSPNGPTSPIPLNITIQRKLTRNNSKGEPTIGKPVVTAASTSAKETEGAISSPESTPGTGTREEKGEGGGTGLRGSNWTQTRTPSAGRMVTADTSWALGAGISVKRLPKRKSVHAELKRLFGRQ
ncbi:uncharacterized protein B0T23DRAFT_335973 [Neurospora hispaniola]|uniref:Uncharacterized protein n=1 Tax=Neurospora hispaniola TaxID=588809 RepID=A0AAJ0IA46_9PEZI|nr:hypothetical protein B0T23DRAFT_335973 [Neurospora hispaniola]